MARGSEIVRQWEILRDIDGARTGIGIAKLAERRGVHPRTIRRDLDALTRAGFPIFDEKVNGTSMWKLTARPFGRLEQLGLGVTEICALYLGRSVLASAGALPMAIEVSHAFDKLQSAIPEPARRFLDRLPQMIRAKVTGTRKQDVRKTRPILNRLADAALVRRRVEMIYHSASSRRTKQYLVDPLRLTAADGGMYLTAWVPEYDELRTFAIERIETLAVTDETFEMRTLPPEPFADSIGAFSGKPEPIEVAFAADIADYVAAREWHRTQQVETRQDGSILMQLHVCNDRPLRTWILGFGGQARVVSPPALAREIFEEILAAREQYMPTLRFEPIKMTLADAGPGRPGLHLRQA